MRSDATLPHGWTQVPLESLAVEGSVTYGVVQPGQAVSGGVPMVRVNNFRGFGLDTSDVLSIATDVEAKYSRTRLRANDVLITVVGTVGQIAVVPPSLAGWNVARAVAVIRPKEAKLSRWIALALRSPESQRALGVAANTTVQTTINLKDLRKLPVPMPESKEREAIELLLGSLDDRIDLLRQTNATLESIAQALFKSWFIDFDPARAKAEGREPEGMNAATAALFPAEFEESALGLIPKGWHASKVGEVFRITMGQSPPGETYNQEGAGVPFYQGRADFGFRFPAVRVYCTAPTRHAREGDALVSVRAPVGDVNVALESCAVGRGVAAVGLDDAQSFALYSMKALRDRFAEYESHGTVFGSINKKQFEALPCVIPSPEVLAAFSCTAGALDDRVRVNELQARSLTDLRDSLLPRLISGTLRLPEAQAQLEEAIA